MKKILFSVLALGVVLTGCHNSDIDYPDFDYQTIYFAKQSPVRTLTMGEERFADNSDDNDHAFQIKAALGGVNENRKTRWAKFAIDNTLCDRVVFEDGRQIKALPENYYNVYTDRIEIKKGAVIGGFTVELTDAFFNDPDAVSLNYVLPVVLTAASDSILQGKAKDDYKDNADRLNKDHWSVLPKDYIFYAIKYKNAYHGCWLSKGVDKIENNGQSKTNTRQPQYWEKAPERYLTTISLNKAKYTFTHSVATVNAAGEDSDKEITCELILTIADNGAVTVSTETPGCTASGSGQWTEKGEKKAFGDEDRDRLALNFTYTIDYVVNDQTGAKATYKAQIDEVMCLRDRQNKLEEFSFKMK